MNSVSSTPVVPPRGITHWRRFSSGLWRVPEGDIAAANSASTLPRIQTFIHEGRRYTNGGGFAKWMHTEANCYPVIPADEFNGTDSVPYSYEGREAIYKGQPFRLGAKTVFVSSDPTVEEWRWLLRVLYADGGLFAAGATYLEFINHRCPRSTENGNTALFKELAECGARAMPRTQAEMIQLLARETDPARPPQQIDFAL